ncbi:peptidylprolyl isomerase [Citrus sinensis]|nr:peptidylprolyl isomerase [Citrus sinensis]
MAVEDEDINPQKKKAPSEDDKRRMKIVPGSLMKAVMRPGGGDSTPSDGDQVAYHCTVRTLDGVIVESTRSEYGGKGIPIRHVLGKSKILLGLLEGIPTMLKGEVSMVPKGLEMGIGTMTREEKAVIYVTSQYLTPSPLMPVVEGCEEVHFEVELVHLIQVRDMLGDGRLIKRRIRDGKGEFPMDCPLHDSLLCVHYKGMLLNEEKKVFYDTRVDNDGQPLEFSSGEGLVPEGFEMCVRLMLPGEIALVTCPPDYAYDKFLRPANVPEGAHIQWEIELLGFEKPKDWTGLSFDGIMDEAEKIRVTGNRLFKEGKFELAKAKYEKVLRDFNHVNPQDDEEGKVFVGKRVCLFSSVDPENIHLYSSACLLKLGECRKSIEACNKGHSQMWVLKWNYRVLGKVLDANPAHVKGLYRRGMAYMALGEFEEAQRDFEMMMKVDKSSEPDATAALSKLKKQRQEVESKARKQFKGLFDKKPGQISEVGIENQGEDQAAGKNENDGSEQESDGVEAQEFHEAAAEAPRKGWFYRFWPTSGRLFSALGLDRCTIL